MKEKVVFILIDALRSDYINKEDSPFLFDFSSRNFYYKKVSQSRSFCERAEVFTGLSPRESGFFTAIGFDPANSPYKDVFLLRIFAVFDSYFIKNRIFRAVRNRLIGKVLSRKRNVFRPYSIPARILPFFSLTEDKYDFRDPEAFDGADNLFKDCRRNGLEIFYDSFTALNFSAGSDDEERMELVIRNIKQDYNLYLLYIGVMDSIAHKFGPDSSERRDALKKLDRRLMNLFDELSQSSEGVKFIILGDHGMAEVKTKVDAGAIIGRLAKQYKMKLGVDFVYFLDSTMLRVWYLNDRARALFDSRLKSDVDLQAHGTFVDAELAESQEIPFPDERYGHTLWMANLGVLVFPDFFHTSSPYKGMHGYDIDDTSSKGTCMASAGGHKYVEDIKLTDVYRLLKDSLGI